MITGGSAPHKPGSTGFVYVIYLDDPGSERSFYPKVFNMEWV